jgi:hypothetical protein
MTRAEIAELLSMCAAFDRRTVGRADVAAWQQVLGDLDAADARQAVAEYYADHRDWIMPADIRQRVRAIRTARITAAHPVYDGNPEETGAQSAAAIRALTAAAASGLAPARPIRAALVSAEQAAAAVRPTPAILAAVGRRIPSEQPHIGVNALAVPCPHCKVDPGVPCTARRRKRRAEVHPGRLEAAQRKAAGLPEPDPAERQADEQRRIAASRAALTAEPQQALP